MMDGTLQNKNKLMGTLSGGSSIRGGVGTVIGRDGKSAYELAVKNGFDGTEEEWLEFLKGEKGDPFRYEDFTPEQLASLKGEKGDAFAFEDFTPEQLEKIKGDPGYTPQKGTDYFDGKDGTDGVSPTIEASKTDNVTTITIKDAEGAKTVTIYDGAEGGSVEVDPTLSVEGMAADAKAVGDKLKARAHKLKILNSAPSGYTEAYTGQIAFDESGRKLYVCVDGIIETEYGDMGSNLFTWEQLSEYKFVNSAPTRDTAGRFGEIWVYTAEPAIYICGGSNVPDGGTPPSPDFEVYTQWYKIAGLPEFAADDEGKTLQIENGAMVWKGVSGVYIGSGDMPDGYNVQIDPDGEGVDPDGLVTEEELARAIDDAVEGVETMLSYDSEKWGESTISKTTVFGVESGDVVWENGYINASSGTVYSKTDTNWWHTPDYMPVRDGDVIRIKGSIISHNSVAMIATYDVNKAYLSEKSVKLAKGDSTYTVSAGDGIAFVRFTLGNGTNYAAQEISITTQEPISTPKENIDHIYERIGKLNDTVKLYSNSMPLIGKTVFLAGDSRSSTDYTFYKTLLEEKCGCLALNQGASGRTAAYNASDAYFERLTKNEHDFSIWLVGGNDTGAAGNIGTFSADSVNGKAGETVVEETDISADYNGTKFVQAIDHIMRKYKSMFYNFKELGNRKFPRMIFCTDLPQNRNSSSSAWSQKENWERKRNAIIECAEKNGVACLDLYKLCHFDMSFEPYWTEPTDKVNDNGLYFMDGLHPNRYGMDIVTSLEIEEMKKYVMTTEYIKQWTMTEDGLIMYCDGINNTGSGHDPTVTTWVDLSGNGNDIINVASSTATTPAETVQGEWLADGMHVINGSKQYLRTATTFDLGADRTVEMRLTMNADANMTVGLYYADRLKLRSGGANFWTRFGTSESVSTYDIKPGKPSRYNVPFTVTMTRHYDADADTTTHRVYVDGIFYAEKSWAGNLRAGETAHVYIGSEYTNVTVHTVRIYNRALTDEEVKSNYWYDEAHFAEGGAE